MKIAQSTIERMAWYIIFVILIIASIGTVAAIEDFHSIKLSQQHIIQNQVNGNQNIKAYINCVIHIDKTGNIQSQIDTCFDTSPKVMK